MSADRVTYLDSSAIVKLAVREAESAALRRYLRRQRIIVSSDLARVEVTRAVLPLGGEALRRARRALDGIRLVRITREVLNTAGTLEPLDLRSLDAIHLATAGLFEETLSRLVTYDDRQTNAARTLGVKVAAPA